MSEIARNEITEVYVVLMGSIKMKMNGHAREVEKGGHITILPGETHIVVEAEPGTLLLVATWPPFHEKDYHLVE